MVVEGVIGAGGGRPHGADKEEVGKDKDGAVKPGECSINQEDDWQEHGEKKRVSYARSLGDASGYRYDKSDDQSQIDDVASDDDAKSKGGVASKG